MLLVDVITPKLVGVGAHSVWAAGANSNDETFCLSAEQVLKAYQPQAHESNFRVIIVSEAPSKDNVPLQLLQAADEVRVAAADGKSHMQSVKQRYDLKEKLNEQ